MVKACWKVLSSSTYLQAGMLIFIVTIFLFLPTFLYNTESDFCQDYLSVNYLLRHQRIYQHLSCGNLIYNAHPPTSVLFFIPFGLLSLIPAAIGWRIFSLCCYLAGGAILLKLVRHYSLPHVLLFVVFTICWPIFYLATEVENIAQLFLLLFALSFFFMQHKRDYFAGIMLGIATLIKIWPITLLLTALVARQYKVFLGGIITIVSGVMLSLLLFGVGTFSFYIHTIQPYERFFLFQIGNISLAGMIVKFFASYADTLHFPVLDMPINTIATICYIISCLVFFGGFLFFFYCLGKMRKPLTHQTRLLLYGFVLTLTIIAFPLSWEWMLLLLLIPILSLIVFLPKFGRSAWKWYILFFIGILAFLDPLGVFSRNLFNDPRYFRIIFVNNSFLSLGVMSLAIAQGSILFHLARKKE